MGNLQWVALQIRRSGGNFWKLRITSLDFKITLGLPYVYDGLVLCATV